MLTETQKLKIWFNNNGRAGTGPSNRKLLDLQPKKSKKRLSTVQAYLKRFFHTKLQPITDSRYKEHLRDVDAGLAVKLTPLDHRNKVVCELWDSESPQVIAEVKRFRQRHFLQGEASNDEDDDSKGGDSGGEDNDNDKAPSKRKEKGKETLNPAKAKAVDYHRSVFSY